MSASPPLVPRAAAVRLWLALQGLASPRGAERLTRARLAAHLERTGGLQLDSIHVVERAHLLTLWSRFGAFDRAALDRWVYRDGTAFEYWAHEACLLPRAHLPLARRRMRRFPGRWRERAWWPHYETSPASRRRVLARLRAEGPVESADFERRPDESREKSVAWAAALPKEDKRSLQLLWHAGRVGVRARRHFRRVYDLAERVLPADAAAPLRAWEDSWLLQGLAANGVATEAHLAGYLTSVDLDAAGRKRVIERQVRAGRVVPVRLEGARGPAYALPEHLDALGAAPEPAGTTLLCPFDSLLWQRRRAEELLDFTYRLEVYTPAAKRAFGYYVLPILHEGRLVGRLDPKLHRDRAVLEVKRLELEKGRERDRALRAGLRAALEDLAAFTGATRLDLPSPWSRRLA